MASSTCCDQNSCSDLSTTSNEDDGSIYTEKNGVIHHFLPGDLVEPCGSTETLMAVGGTYGTMNTVQTIWLDSKQPISSEDVSTALYIVSRQVPHLQFCLARRGVFLWFRRMKKFTMDFETSTRNVMDVYYDMLHTKYDIWKGPLWKVRLVVPDPSTLKEKEEKYSTALVFSIQHSITDGTTNMHICRQVVSILNQFTAGKSVTPKFVPLAPNIDEVTRKSPMAGKYLAKYFSKKFIAVMLRSYHVKTSFSGNIPLPKIKKPETKVLFADFSKLETKNMLKMCKAASITIHSFIIAITNLALMTIAQSRSKTPIGPTNVNANHCVNMRRYFEPQHKDAAGCHISFMAVKTKMSLADAGDFWALASKIHNSLKERLEVVKEPIKIIPIVHLARIIYPANVFLTSQGYKNKTDCHYVTTNMGNLKDLLPGPKEGDNVEITYLLRSVSSTLAGNPFLLTFHTFRERFMISIDYYTNKMTDEVAEEFFGVLCQFIRNMVNANTLQGIKKC